MDEPYSKREEDEFRRDVRNSLQRLEIQTALTNGRVTKLERYMLIVGTATAVLIAVKFPELLAILTII